VLRFPANSALPAATTTITWTTTWCRRCSRGRSVRTADAAGELGGRSWRRAHAAARGIDVRRWLAEIPGAMPSKWEAAP
jgi:hypothetical protein